MQIYKNYQTISHEKEITSAENDNGIYILSFRSDILLIHFMKQTFFQINRISLRKENVCQDQRSLKERIHITFVLAYSYSAT